MAGWQEQDAASLPASLQWMKHWSHVNNFQLQA